jgi:hypothetical protein
MFYNFILLKWISLHQFPSYSFFIAKFNEVCKIKFTPIMKFKGFYFLLNSLFNIVFEFLKCFRTWSLFLKILISIVMFLSLMKAIKCLVPLRDLVVMGPQMLMCTISKTFSTFHLFSFKKTILHYFHVKHISQMGHYISRSLCIPKALFLYLWNCVGLQNSCDLICNCKKFWLW